MIIEQQYRKMYSFTCYNCHTRLLLEESDFKTDIMYYGNNTVEFTHISTPCPVCGKLWDNVEKYRCSTRMIPIS